MPGTPVVVTVKTVALVSVFPATVTVMVPVVAPDGTDVVIDVAVLAVTVDVAPLNITVLPEGVVLKFVPVMMTEVPDGPDEGVKPVIVGNTDAPIVKSFTLNAVMQFVVTEILPVAVPDGTLVVMLVVVLAVTTAVIPLKKFTTLFAGTVLKFVPVIVTAVPIPPEAGVKELMEGVRPPACCFNLCINREPDPLGTRLKTQAPGSKSAVPRKLPVVYTLLTLSTAMENP